MTYSIKIAILPAVNINLEVERTRRFREGLNVVKTPFQSRGRGRLWMSLALALAVTTIAACAATPDTSKGNKTPTVTPIERQTPQGLGAEINEADFFRVAAQGARWGLLPNTSDKDKLACPNWSPGICVGSYTSNFKVAINGPMADLMFRQTQATNPLKPLKVILVEDWIKADTGEPLAGGTDKSEKEIRVAVSLKAVAWNVFKLMEADKTFSASNADEYFEGTMSLLSSRVAVHELLHAGAESKRLGLTPAGVLTEVLHPQIYAQEEKYAGLVQQAGRRGYPEGGLIFGVQPVNTFRWSDYREQIYREAGRLGVNEIPPS